MSGRDVWWGSGTESDGGTCGGEASGEANGGVSGKESGRASGGGYERRSVDRGASQVSGRDGVVCDGHPGCFLHCVTGRAPCQANGGGGGAR